MPEDRFTLCIAGATGATGRRVAHAARAAGAELILAGRDQSALTRLRAELGCGEIRIIDLDDATSIDSVLADADVVASCVGPFGRWGIPIAESAVRTATPYVDTTGEPAYCLTLIRRFADAVAPIVPAVGLSSLLGDLAAAISLQEGGDADDVLSLVYHLDGLRPSAGTMRSTLDILGDGAMIIRDGLPRTVLPGGSPRQLPTGDIGVCFAVPDPIIVSRYHPARSIDAYLVTPVPRLIGAVMRASARACARPRLRTALLGVIDRLPATDTDRPGRFSVTAVTGMRTTTARCTDVYGLTATGVAQVAKAVASWSGPGGVHAASQILGEPRHAAEQLGIDIRQS